MRGHGPNQTGDEIMTKKTATAKIDATLQALCEVVDQGIAALAGKNVQVVVEGITFDDSDKPTWTVPLTGSGLNHPTLRYHHRKSRTKRLEALGLKVLTPKKERGAEPVFVLQAA